MFFSQTGPVGFSEEVHSGQVPFLSHHIKGINSIYHCDIGLNHLAEVVLNLSLNCTLVTFIHSMCNNFLQLSDTPFPDEELLNLKCRSSYQSQKSTMNILSPLFLGLDT